MKRTGCTKPAGIFAALLTGLMFVALLAIPATPLGAQTAPAARPGQGFGPAYDAAHETILAGTIQEVVTKHTVGSPAGMHLLVAGAKGVVDTHLGPFLSKDTKEALQTGMPVQIVGATVQLHDKEFFLARQVTIGGRTITIRNNRGMLVHPRPQGQRIVKVNGTAVETKGGVQ
jgi:hypothetical protein